MSEAPPSSVTSQKIVKPEAIETELRAIWEKLAKENKMRACLFNLIVFNRYSARTDYIRSIVQKVIEKFPCRLLFVSEDPDTKESYLKTAVSVIFPQKGEGSIACDHIDIGVGGQDIERASFVLLPHVLPDLPTILLWMEDPSKPHPLFLPLSSLAHRIIFDSEASDNLLAFSKTVLALKAIGKFDVADLNWARTEGWRDLLGSLFHTPERLKQLKDLSELEIVYNDRATEFFCHLKIQSMYLLAWLAGRLHWNFKKADKKLHFTFQDPLKAAIISTTWEKLGPGTVIGLKFKTKNQEVFDCARIKESYHRVNIEISSQEKCDLPYQFVLGQTATGQSLVQEICMKGTSTHYLEMLKLMQTLDEDVLC